MLKKLHDQLQRALDIQPECRISIWSTVLCLSYCEKLKADTVQKLIISQEEDVLLSWCCSFRRALREDKLLSHISEYILTHSFPVFDVFSWGIEHLHMPGFSQISIENTFRVAHIIQAHKICAVHDATRCHVAPSGFHCQPLCVATGVHFELPVQGGSIKPGLTWRGELHQHPSFVAMLPTYRPEGVCSFVGQGYCNNNKFDSLFDIHYLISFLFEDQSRRMYGVGCIVRWWIWHMEDNYLHCLPLQWVTS